MSPLVQLFLLALLGSIIALIGGVVFLYNERLSSALEKHSVPFAAGVLVTVALVGLLPEAVDVIGEAAFFYILLTFFGAYAFESVVFNIHHHDGNGHKNESSGLLVIVGDTIHNLIDGVAISASFMVSPGLGLITALSTFLHEVPHEIGDFGIMLRAGWKKGKILLINLFSASMTIVGAFGLLLFNDNEALIGGLLAVSAGIFLYLGASDFLPKIGEGYKSRAKAVLPLAIGVIAMLVTLSLVPHSH